MKKALLISMLIFTGTVQAESFSKELPFELVYSHDKKPKNAKEYTPDVDYLYIGSQIINGDVEYVHGEMDGNAFYVTINSDSLHKVPKIATFPKDKNQDEYSFVVNSHHHLEDSEERQNAADFYGIKTNMDSQRVKDYNCKLSGPVQLQITEIQYRVYGHEFELFASSPQVIKSGPFKTICEDI